MEDGKPVRVQLQVPAIDSPKFLRRPFEALQFGRAFWVTPSSHRQGSANLWIARDLLQHGLPRSLLGPDEGQEPGRP